MSELNQELLKEHLEYRDGHLWWIKPTNRRIKIGQQFGCCNSEGYIFGGLRGKYYSEHRLIWLYHCGKWPKECIDHINGVRDDNRIENLREATNQQNQFNRKSEKDSSSQYKGVSWCKLSKKWRAYYQHKGKLYYRGVVTCHLSLAAIMCVFISQFVALSPWVYAAVLCTLAVLQLSSVRTRKTGALAFWIPVSILLVVGAWAWL